jgi:hypothetical protein
VNQQIIPLLDGLDEMEEPERAPCITAINTYHLAHLHPLVVCSRSAEYVTASHAERLALQRAVVVKPLAAIQIEATLGKGGKALAGLRAAYRHNTALQELATTPLLLNLLILTYQNTPARALPTKGAALQRRVFEQYVERMVARKGDPTRYPLTHTIHWLTFLAQQMRFHNQTAFAIEALQPSWLARKPQLGYHWSIRLSVGLIAGLSVALSVALSVGLIAGLIAGPIVALIVALIVGLEQTITLTERIQWSWKAARSGLIVALIGGPIVALSAIVGLSAGLIAGLIAGLLVALSIGLLVALSFGLTSKQEIERNALSPGEGLTRSLKNGLIVVLSFGLIAGLLAGLRTGLSFGLIAGLIAGLLFGLNRGLDAFFQHLVLRFWLWRAGVFPFRAIAFLEDARARHLLKRVGGTYQFMHRLLLDYFAESEPF